MTQWHLKSKRKRTGGLKTTARRRDKILAEKGGEFSATGISENEKEQRKTLKTLGGNTKTKARKIKFAAITNPKTKKTVKAEVISVVQNDANRQYTRQNVMTKGAVIKIKIDGKDEKARVTSRPGQSGTVQGVLIMEQSPK